MTHESGSRTYPAVCLAMLLVLLSGTFLARDRGWLAEPAPALVPVATVLPVPYDPAMIRRRAAVAVRLLPGASPARAARDLPEGLVPATFAVFDDELLGMFVPELTFVAPEGVGIPELEAKLRTRPPTGSALTVVRSVLVHDLTFVAFSAGQRTRSRAAEEGYLGPYEIVVQPAGVTVHYEGALLSEAQISGVRAALARAADLDPARVRVEATLPGPGAGGPEPHGHR